MQFKDIIGQQEVKADLLAQLREERVPHAQLFLGPEGCGKLALALACAQYLQCEQPGQDDSCGSCGNCTRASLLTHPDIHFSFPVVGPKATSTEFLEQWRAQVKESPYFSVNDWMQRLGAENKQGNITAEECLQIVKTFGLKVFEGNYKVWLLWMPEYLGKEGNRLLKLIEEPEPHTVFFLIGEQSDRILNTILSRCQLYRIPPLSDEEIAEGLHTAQGLDSERSREIARMADGNFRDAIQLGQTGEAHISDNFLEWMRLCFQGKVSKLHPWIDLFAGIGRENQKQFFRYGLHFSGALVRMKASDSEEVRLGDKEAATARKLAELLSEDALFGIASLFNEGILLIERNINPRIVMMDVSLHIHEHMTGRISAFRS